MIIKSIGLNTSDLQNTPVIEGQLLYCLDTKEAYFDISNKNRISVGFTIQVNTEYDKIHLPNILTTKVYVVVESNKLYRFVNNEFIEVTDYTMIVDLISPIESMKKCTLTKNGKAIAPYSLAKYIFTNDGDNVEDKLKNLAKDDKKTLLYTRTEHVITTHDGQRVFSIPFPIPNYDLAIHPMLIIYKDRILASKDYTISNEQVVISNNLDGLKKDDILTFIFHYNVILTNNNLNAESINNVRFFVGDKEPIGKRETDVWFDTKRYEVKQFTNGKWVTIVKSTMVDDYPFYILKNTTVLRESSNFVEIGIPGFDNDKDTLFVYMNSSYLEEGKDYTISVDNNHIINVNGDIWLGDVDDIIFNFVALKATNKDSKSKVVKNTIYLDKITNKVEISNFVKNKDTLFVYENSVYLEEGDDYIISEDGSYIQCINGEWNGIEGVVLNTVIIKNSITHVNEDGDMQLPYANTVLKQQVFDVLDVTEEEFNKIKDLIKSRGE